MVLEIIKNYLKKIPSTNKVVDDITERKSVEERINVSEKRCRTLLENSPVCTKIMDLDFNLQYMSTAGIKALKIDDITQLYGKPLPFDLYLEPSRNKLINSMEKVKEAGRITELEASVVDVVGNELWFHHTIVPVNNSEGRIDYLMIISADVTERRRREIEIKELNETLEQRVAERTTELAKANEELLKMQKLESVGVLAGGIAHDFNNSLQGILSNIAIAKSYTDSNDKIYSNLNESEKAVIQAKNLTQQLLTFSKGGDPIKKAVFVCELIKDSANLALSGSNVRCELELPDCKCLVEVDKGQINQVFNNLFINANQAMQKGGVIKVTAEHYNIEKKDLIPLPEGRYIKITIKDSGTGISQEHLQKIFDPYFTTRETGSGLGLATVFSIIKKHDGHIDVESEVGVGTTFYIYLPASQKEISKEPVPGKAREISPELAEGEKATSLDGRKILFMEDESIISLAVTRQLRNLNYEVETARDGFEAIELYKSASESGKPFNAIVMDLTIPGGMGGEEAIKELLKIDPDVAAIVASGYSNDPIMTNFGEYGFKGVVEKPFEIDELEEVLQKVIMEKGT